MDMALESSDGSHDQVLKDLVVGAMAQYCITVLSQLAGTVQLAGWLAGPASQLGYIASWAI